MLEYYDNQYDKSGKVKLNSIPISSEIIKESGSNLKFLYDLNMIEFQSLNNLIKKQEKVVSIYLKKNKKDEYRITNSSLQLLFNYNQKFLNWFSKNKT